MSWLSGMPRQMWRKEDDFYASWPREIHSPPIDSGGASQPIVYKGTAEVDFPESGRVPKVKGIVVDRVEDLGQEYGPKLTPKNLKQGTLTRSQFEHHHDTLREIRRLVETVKKLHGEQYPRGNYTYDWAVSKTLVCNRDAKNK
jgi:hypothetical protein